MILTRHNVSLGKKISTGETDGEGDPGKEHSKICVNCFYVFLCFLLERALLLLPVLHYPK